MTGRPPQRIQERKLLWLKKYFDSGRLAEEIDRRNLRLKNSSGDLR